VEISGNIDYILNAVLERGCSRTPCESNDFSRLLQKKDFKDLIALEIYECYFWEERHEFDLQLLRELVESVAEFFQDPDTLMHIKAGFLETIPSAIVIAIVSYIWGKLKKLKKKTKESEDESSSWLRIKKNTEKIDKEFKNHDYVLTDEIERIFEVSRDEMQPLLKLMGCKCYYDRNRSIWIKPGVPDAKIREILQKHKFKSKK